MSRRNIESPRLGWIGLGSMGLAMATNMQNHLSSKSLPPLIYYNRTMSRGDSLKDIGSRPSSIQDLVQTCDIIFISVSDDSALQSIADSILDSGSITNKTFVDTTTVHPRTSASIASQLAASSASYVSAPVFGSTPTAIAGQVLVAIAGPPEAISLISPFLQGVIARGVINVGTEPEKATLLKTTGNFITAGIMYLLSEAHTLAEKTGLPADTLHSLVEQNLGPYVGGVSKRLISGVYCPAECEAPQSGLELGIKDVGHGVSLAKEEGMKLKVGEMYLDAAREAKEWGDENRRRLDSSSVFGSVRRKAGLEFESAVVKERDGKAREE